MTIGCQTKEDSHFFNLRGSWYGYLDPHYVSEPKKYISLELDGNGEASVSVLFHSNTSGWYASKGAYTVNDDGEIEFNIVMTPPDFFKDHPDIPKITLTRAITDHSELSGDLLKLHFDKEYREDYFDDALKGKTTSHFIWLDRDRPSLSPRQNKR